MQRRDFLKSTVAVAVAVELGAGKAQAMVPAHNWGNYDFGSGPQVTDRLNQGPFPQYPPDSVIPFGRGRTELWQGTGHLYHSRQRHRGNQIGQYFASDRGLGSLSIGSAALYPSDLEGGAAAAWTPGAARLRKASS
jgi:hypothetical protein